MRENYIKKLILIFIIGVLSSQCSEKELSKDPEEAYAQVKEPYDDEDWEIAVTKLGEFKSRFPYSRFAVEAELLIANCHYNLGNYEESAVAYSQFAKLHPKHEKLDFALFRVGESYWQLSPEDIDREQEFTHKAVEEWEVLVNKQPNSSYSEKARKLIQEGKTRIAKSFEFVANFYCKQDLYHACAFRFINLAREFPQFKEMRKNALEQAYKALMIVSKEKKEDPKSDKNIYFNTLTSDQIKALARKLRDEARNERSSKSE